MPDPNYKKPVEKPESVGDKKGRLTYQLAVVEDEFDSIVDQIGQEELVVIGVYALLQGVVDKITNRRTESQKLIGVEIPVVVDVPLVDKLGDTPKVVHGPGYIQTPFQWPKGEEPKEIGIGSL